MRSFKIWVSGLACFVALGAHIAWADPGSLDPSLDERSLEPPGSVPVDAKPTTAPLGEPTAPAVTPVTPAPAVKSRFARFGAVPQAWPRKILAVRAGLSGGMAWIPTLGLGTAFSTSSSLVDLSPILGAEVGYLGRHWGASVTFDGAPFGILSASTLSRPPTHWAMSVNLNYVSSHKLRWLLGVEPYANYGIVLPSGEGAVSRGFGFRFGAHYRLEEPEESGWELFSYTAVDIYREIEAGVGTNTQTYARDDLGLGGTYLGYFTVVVGMQWTLGL